MNTFQLECFIAVAENLNFARAAEAMSITQPAMTHQIRTLEEELKVKLFKRTTRSVEMTEEGSVFWNDAKEMIALARRAAHRFANPPKEKIQPFSIGCYGYAQLFLLPEALREMAEIYPSLHPRLQVVPFGHLFRLLEEERVDLVIGFEESERKKVPGIYREMVKVPIVCLCGEDSPLAKKKKICVEDLESERLILNDPDKCPANVARLQGMLMGGRKPSEFFFCESAESVMVLAEAGFGAAMLPAMFIPPEARIVQIPMEGIEPISFGVYYKTLQGKEPLKKFIGILQKTIRERRL